MLVTLGGMMMPDKPLHPANVSRLILVILGGMVMLPVSALQLSNAEEPMMLTPGGMVMSVSATQPLNALLSILLRPVGRVMRVSLLQSWNIPLSILVTPGGMVSLAWDVSGSMNIEITDSGGNSLHTSNMATGMFSVTVNAESPCGPTAPMSALLLLPK